MILIDTDIAIDLFRQHLPAIQWLEALGEEMPALPGYVAMELIQGCRDRRALDATVNELAAFQVVWPDSEACNDALKTYSMYGLSHGLGLLDCLIAHTAIGLNKQPKAMA